MSDVMVIASKVKAYIKKEHEMKTSASVIKTLTEVVTRKIDAAVANTKADKRIVVSGKDFD